MAQWVKVLVVNFWQPEFDPGTYINTEEMAPEICPLTSTLTQWYTQALPLPPHGSIPLIALKSLQKKSEIEL